MQQEKDNKKAKTFSARINRHLLFNSLNAAVALCRRRPEQAAELLIKLSDCLLYTSEEKPNLVSLYDELEFIRSYLYVQSVRFGKRLHIDYPIDNDASAMIPPFAIYVILDNVFEHVMMKTTDKVSITIIVRQENGATTVTIEDNGTGIAEEKVKNFMKEYQGSSLEQLNQLLKQNGMPELEIRSTKNKGTSVTIHTIRL